MPKAKAEAPALFADGELAAAPDVVLTEALAVFNAIVGRLNVDGKTIWRGAKVLTDARRKRLKTAVQDCGGNSGWRKALEDAARNSFLLGKEGRNESHRNWIPDLDFFIQPKTVIKLVEGGYSASIEVRQKLHIPMAYAPRKVEAPFVQTETLEQRLAASIVSYRRHGKYAEANRIEERLAALEKRDPVMVPAPEVAHIGMPERAPEIPRKPSYPVTDLVDEYDVPEAPDYGGDE